MSRSAIETRIRKLEASHHLGRDQIPVWCETREDMPAMVERMVEIGQIAQADRQRCVFWTDWTGAPIGAHERALVELEWRA